MYYLNFSILAFSANYCPTKIDLYGNTVLLQVLGCQIDFFGIFNELLATQNVNVARFARNVE